MSNTWHYVLMKHVEENGDVWYGVHEDYGKLGCTQNPVKVSGENLDDVVWQLKAILNDIFKYEVKDYV